MYQTECGVFFLSDKNGIMIDLLIETTPSRVAGYPSLLRRGVYNLLQCLI